MDTDTKKKILIMDDETQLALLYKSSLEGRGYEVALADNAETGLQMAREMRPDLIVLDLMMPRLNGFDAIDLLRSTPETQFCRIVILSALSQPEDVSKAKQLGANDYIVKSELSLTEFMDRVAQVLNGVPGS